MSENKKTCSICGVEKDVTEYYKRSGRCKPCYVAQATSRYKKNREKLIDDAAKKTHYCSYCDVSALTSKILEKHYSTVSHMKKLNETQNRLTCEICKFTTSSCKELIRHTNKRDHYVKLMQYNEKTEPKVCEVSSKDIDTTLFADTISTTSAIA